MVFIKPRPCSTGFDAFCFFFYSFSSAFFFSPSVVSAPFSVSALRGEKKTNVDGL